MRVKYLAVYGRRGFVCVAAKEVSEYSIGVEFVCGVFMLVGRAEWIVWRVCAWWISWVFAAIPTKVNSLLTLS